jgi:hypothetical protein
MTLVPLSAAQGTGALVPHAVGGGVPTKWGRGIGEAEGEPSVPHAVGEGAPTKWGRGIGEAEGKPVENLPKPRPWRRR